jgi:hypothetical protein
MSRSILLQRTFGRATPCIHLARVGSRRVRSSILSAARCFKVKPLATQVGAAEQRDVEKISPRLASCEARNCAPSAISFRTSGVADEAVKTRYPHALG